MALASGILKKGTLYYADPHHIVVRKGWNPRFDFGDITELEKSIKTGGFSPNKPILVRRNEEGMFEIIDGERRFKAVKNLMKKGALFEEGIPIIITDRATTDAEAMIDMFTANNGKPFLPLEEAHAFARMKDMGFIISQIAAQTGRSDTHIIETLALLTADPSVKEAVQDKKLSGTLAKQIATKVRGDNEKQKELVEKATSSPKGKKEVAEEVGKLRRRALNSKQATIPTALTPAQIKELQVKMQELSKFAIEEIGSDIDSLREKIKSDNDLSAAYFLGAHTAVSAVLDSWVKVPL